MSQDNNPTVAILLLVKAVVAEWAATPVSNIQVSSELENLRHAGLSTLGLMLRAKFDLIYGARFDEKRFESMWLTAKISTVEHCYWLVDLSFT